MTRFQKMHAAASPLEGGHCSVLLFEELIVFEIPLMCRKCEICGEMVNNIKGVGADKFMEEWIESGVRNSGIDINPPNSSQRSREEVCWHGQPFCNFLMACLVIAFVLPWFFRINGGIW